LDKKKNDLKNPRTIKQEGEGTQKGEERRKKYAFLGRGVLKRRRRWHGTGGRRTFHVAFCKKSENVGG